MQRRLPIALVCALCGSALAGPVQGASARTSPAQILATAEEFVTGLGAAGMSVRATAGPLDPRLSLAACAGDLTPFLPAGAAVRPRTSVGVRCPDAGGWSIYVPVAVEAETTVLVARRSLSRGEVPAAGDVDAVRRTVPGLGLQFVARAADISGRRLRLPVAAGQPIPVDALGAPMLVARGQQVTVISRGTAIAVRAGAVALENGGNGDRVRVRNAVSGRVVEGRVQPDGTVAANP
jgi:flagella basal body P-ring formation protein FlgA